MSPTEAEHRLPRYEGLIFKHALRIAHLVEEELDDIRQVYRLKAWRALRSFDPSKATGSVDRYVFSCLKNAEKDLLKKRRRDELFIEDVAPVTRESQHQSRDRFEARHLAVGHEAVYGLIDDEAVLLPNTLSNRELRVVILLYRDYRQFEIANRMGISKQEMERTMRSIRVKMGDWRPSQDEMLEGESAPGRIAVAA